MWSKILKSKQAQDDERAGPRKTGLSLKKVKSFNFTNSSQLTLDTPQLVRCSSQEVLNPSQPKKAARRSSFNILIRRPSIDALRSPPATPSSPFTHTHTHTHSSRSRAATFGGSVRSILREPNTPATAQAKNVRFESHRPAISLSTPPEETPLFRPGRSGSVSSLTPRFASSQQRSRRPSVAEIFAPLESPADSPQHLVEFFQQIDVAAITSLTEALHVPNDDLPRALTSTPHKEDDRRTDSSEGKLTHDPNDSQSVPFGFGQTVFHSVDSSSSSKRSSGGTSSGFSDITSSSSSPSMGRSRSFSDTAFMSMMRDSPLKAGSSSSSLHKGSTGPDPFSANATTYYTPQTMIPTTPPQGTSPRRHVRRASKEENIIFSLQTKLDLQNELCVQLEADLRARDELVETLGKKLAAAEEEDAKKRKYLRAWKKRVTELEQTCRSLEGEVEGSRQQSMERSVMDEASSEALRMLHRQISGLERERDVIMRTEVVLRKELGRMEALAGEHRSEATKLRESLASQSQSGDSLLAIEQQRNEEKQRHKAMETQWQVERDQLLASLNDSRQQLRASDDKVVGLESELLRAEARAAETTGFLEAAEGGKCALVMERDCLKLQSAKLQERAVAAEEACSDAECQVLQLENELQRLRDSLEARQDLLTKRVGEEEDRVDVVTRKLAASERRVAELNQERQDAFAHVSRLEDTIRRQDAELSEVPQRTLAEMERVRREHAAVVEHAIRSKQMEIDAQATNLVELKAEIDRMNSETRELREESAAKEVRIAELADQLTLAKQDAEGSTALDSKQQLKRRPGVRNMTGNTTVLASKTMPQRRESSTVLAPRTSRPASLISDSGADPGRDRKPSVEGGTKIPTMNKSARLNSSAATPAKRGSMGPPLLRPRSSISTTPATTLTSKAHIRSPSSAVSGVKRKPSAEHEKENADTSVSRRLSRIPTLAQ